LNNKVGGCEKRLEQQEKHMNTFNKKLEEKMVGSDATPNSD